MKKTLALIAVFAVILVGADFAAAAVAEDRVSSEMREQFALAEDPDVTIHGFPFMTQAIGGNYRHISASAQGVGVTDSLRDLELLADLRDVDAPLTDVLAGNTDEITVGELGGAVRITEADLGRTIRFPTLQISEASGEYASTGGENDPEAETDTEETQGEYSFDSTAGIELTATTDIAGDEVEIVAVGVIELTGDGVRVSPKHIQLGRETSTTVLPDQVRESLLPQFETTIDPGNLPFNVAPTGVAVESGTLIVQGEAEDVRFSDVG